MSISILNLRDIAIESFTKPKKISSTKYILNLYLSNNTALEESQFDAAKILEYIKNKYNINEDNIDSSLSNKIGFCNIDVNIVYKILLELLTNSEMLPIKILCKSRPTFMKIISFFSLHDILDNIKYKIL